MEYLAGIAIIGLWIDAYQTLQIRKHPGWEEGNRALGKHPTDLSIIGWYILWSAICVVCAIWLYSPLAVMALLAISFSEYSVIYQNYKTTKGKVFK